MRLGSILVAAVLGIATAVGVPRSVAARGESGTGCQPGCRWDGAARGLAPAESDRAPGTGTCHAIARQEPVPSVSAYWPVPVPDLVVCDFHHGTLEAAQGGGSTAPQAAPKDGDAAALSAFRASIDNYLGLRKKISQEIPPLVVTPRAAEINAASDALARAVQRARPGARQGNFFTPAVATALQRQLEQTLQKTDREAVMALITEEPSAVKRPTVHMRFPAGDVLATTPAVVLEALPPLPKELEYRFIGTTLVLRDVAAALVLDYVPNAIKAR